jgi:cytochrome c
MLNGQQYLAVAISGPNYPGELVAYKVSSGDSAPAQITQAQPRPQPTVAAGAPLYTAAQAARGLTTYKQRCAVCHGDSLEGIEMAPSLAGGDFMDRWTGQTMGDLFERIRATMPKDRPGSLSRDVNADITAYMLSMNQYPAGTADLPSDAQTLSRIRIQTPKR